MVYKTSGVCSSAISFEIDDAGKVHDVKFQGGCSGNTCIWLWYYSYHELKR